MTNFLIYLTELIIFWGIPLAVIIFFTVSLVKFVITDKNDAAKYKKRKKMLIISSVIAGIFVLSVVGLVVLASLAIAHM